MIEVKIDIKPIVQNLEEKLRKEIEREILGVSIWDIEETSNLVVDAIKDIVKEVLEENREKLKEEVEEQFLSCAKDIIAETISELF